MTAELDFSPLHRNRQKGEQIPMLVQPRTFSGQVQSAPDFEYTQTDICLDICGCVRA
jgi:hypothetical protein